MSGVVIDRRREAGNDEGDAGFLDRIDMLVMAEWDRRRRGKTLRQLHADYAARTEFLALLGDLLMIRDATGGLAPLPSRLEMEQLLRAVRQEQGGEPEPECPPVDWLEEEWPAPTALTGDRVPSTCS